MPRPSIRIRPLIGLLCVGLTVPLFATVIAITYHSNNKAASETAGRIIGQINRELELNLQQLLDPITTLLRAASANAATSPDPVRAPTAFGDIAEILDHSDSVARVYAGFEDGSLRAVERIVKRDSTTLPPAPDGAVISARQILRDQASGAEDRLFWLGPDRRSIADQPATQAFDPRQRPWYRQALAERKTVISAPYVFAFDGSLGVSIAQPVFRGDSVQGVIAADLTLSTLGAFLKTRQPSPNSMSLILDSQDRVVAWSEGATASGAHDASAMALTTIRGLSSDLPALALALMPPESKEDGVFQFRHPSSGEPYAASYAKVNAKAQADWKILTLAPLSDFLPEIRQTNVHMALLGAAALALQLLLIVFVSRRLAQPLEQMALRVASIERLRPLPLASTPESRFTELRQLSQSIDNMSRTISAFAAFVPAELVRSLLSSESKLEIGGRSRFLTIMFCDLESFSTLSENTPSQELLVRVSRFLEVATKAVNEELGTLDKFIGDGVMAFWGAPQALEDHAWRACRAALKIQERMGEINAGWQAQGLSPLNVRIGIHSDSVLVGNIGSSERMAYTVMGDGVNIAAHLEALNKELGTRICVSKSVFREAGERLVLRPLRDVTVKGRSTPVSVYELLGTRDPESKVAQTPQSSTVQ